MANEMRLIDANKFNKKIEHIPMWGSVASYMLEHFPTVDAVEVVHGRWQRYTDEIFMGYDSRGRIKYRKRYTYECTCCGENKLSKTNYCPNCGAKMDGGNEG